jgi:c-di-AMP phosphodiesterase-like protein
MRQSILLLAIFICVGVVLEAKTIDYRKMSLELYETYHLDEVKNPFQSKSEEDVFFDDLESVKRSEVFDDSYEDLSILEVQNFDEIGALIPREDVLDIEDLPYDFVMTGVGRTKDIEKVFFKNLTTGKSYYLAERESEDGIKVVSVKEDLVVLRVEGEDFFLPRDF